MGMQQYEEAFALVEDHRDQAHFAPAPPPGDRVERAEQALGIRFPPTYRRFVTELGAGGIGSEDVYGVVNDDFEDVRPPGAIGYTRDLRRRGFITDDMVVIYALGDGTYYALDTARSGPDGEAPVVAFIPGAGAAPDEFEVVFPDFGSFFLDTIRFDLDLE